MKKKRYLSKITLLSGIDPYILKMDELLDDIAILPPLRYLFTITITIVIVVIFALS